MNNPKYDIYRASPNFRLLGDRNRLPIEAAVSAYYNREWRVQSFEDMNDYASHPSALLSDGYQSVFVKLSEAAHGLDQFQVELSGLRLLSERAAVLTPPPVGIILVEGGVILILEAVQPVERTNPQWREIGRTLARIHQVKGERCGLETQGYFGPLYQDNRPMPGWLDFYVERRIWPRLMGAIDSGNLPTETIRQVERLLVHLPGLDIPVVKPSLLHGDAQRNNFISTAAGAVVIDPAIYYGNPEIDLAYVDYFQPVPEDLFLGYQEILPIDPGFAERRDLWRISAYLGLVAVVGTAYLDQLTGALRKYVS